MINNKIKDKRVNRVLFLAHADNLFTSAVTLTVRKRYRCISAKVDHVRIEIIYLCFFYFL